ncbi:MAG TPA: hypothetical protein VF898_08505 [Chloroflexota bacterium]
MGLVIAVLVIAVALILLGWVVGHYRRRNVGVDVASTPVARNDR